MGLADAFGWFGRVSNHPKEYSSNVGALEHSAPPERAAQDDENYKHSAPLEPGAVMEGCGATKSDNLPTSLPAWRHMLDCAQYFGLKGINLIPQQSLASFGNQPKAGHRNTCHQTSMCR